MISLVEDGINKALNEDQAANESNPLGDFNRKASKRFFATISAYIDKSFFTDKTGRYDEKAHQRYNEWATLHLQNDLKWLGLEYQKISGLWEYELEKSFLVWNTAYTYQQFESIMLQLNKSLRQWAICICRWDKDKYLINLWQTDSLENISYYVVDEFTKVSPVEAIKGFGTILTRKIRNKNGELTLDKVPAIKFEALESNVCCAASESMGGHYARERLMKEYFGRSLNPLKDF